MHRLHCLLIAALLLLSPLTALAGDHQWSGNGPFATGLGNRVITALALSSDGKQVYAGTGSGTVHHYAYTAPTATSGATTGISSSGATLNGSVNAHDADATVSFEYGLTTAYGTRVGATPGTLGGATDTAVSTSLSGLTAGATYHFRVVATNSSGTSYGNDLFFTVGKLNQTIGAVSFLPNSLVVNGTTTASATASSGLAVTFTSITPTVCTVSGSTITGVAVGTCTIAGNQAGSGAYNAATQVTQNISVGKGTASVVLGSLNPTYNGASKSATATTTPTGLTVGFTYDGSATAPTAVGSYVVVGTINDPNYQGTASGTLVIGEATATVVLGNLTQTYDGMSNLATATTTPTALTVDFTYAGSATAPTAVGSYAVVGTINDASYQGTATGTLVISKATATVTLGSFTQTYDGSAKAATAATTPTGLTVGFTYDGSATAPTAVGSYAVVGTINDANYQGSANGTLVIGSATASVSLGGLEQTYDGSAKAATATTTPTGLTVGFTYDGSATVPTAVGSYAVVGTINDANYQGTATGTLVINNATATVALGGLAQTYDGSAKTATATTTPTGLTVDFTYDGSATAPTAVGSYAVVGTINDANYQGTATGTLVINNATATVTLGGLTQTYDNSPKAATATTTPTGLTVGFTYDGSATEPTAVGSYAVVGTINDANYQGSATGTLVISSATATVTLGNLTQTYDGSAKVATATTNPAGLTVGFIYDGSSTAPTAVGNYAVICTINDANYQGSASGTLVISTATASVTLGNLTQAYDGSAKAATATTTPAGLTVGFTYDGSATAPTAVGSYSVVGTINEANYQGSASGTLVISNATATVTLGALAQTYDGSAKAATATTTPTGLTVGFTYDGSATAPTAVGSYAVVGTINDANYQGSTSGTLVVKKATATVTLGALTQTYDNSAKAATATTTPTGLTVGFTYDGSATVPTAVGSYVVVGTINDANYQGSVSGNLVIADVLVYHVTPSSGTGGSIIPATVQTVIDGGSTSFTLNVETGYQIDNVSGCGGSLTGSTYAIGIINSNCTVIASFALIPDTTPPVLTLSTLPDGAVTRSADLNLAGRVSDETAMGRLTINGIPVVIHADNSFSQLMTLVEGSNTLTTIATDAEGNSVTDIRSITLDSTAPSLTIMTPVDNGQTGTAILTVSGTIEAGALCDLVLNGESPLVATVSDTNYSLDITLSEGLNSIDVTGSDNLGNSTTLHRTITLDSEAPRVQITAPNADSTVNDSTLILEGSASDATSAVSISLNIDGQIFIPPLDSNGHFSLNLALTEERTYVVILTARDALGNQSSVTRNFIYKRPYLWGDTNGDELVDVDDALLTLQIAVGIEPLQPKNLLRGDVAPLINGRPQPDGKLTAGDALIILRRAVGLVNW